MKKTLRVLTLVLTLSLLLSTLILPAQAKSLTLDYLDVKIVVEGVTITPKDVNGKFVEPFVFEGTTYLPARALSEALNKEVFWNAPEALSSVYMMRMSW